MMWRVVKSTDRGYVTASDNFDDFEECMAELRTLSDGNDDYFAIQELPNGSIVWDEISGAATAQSPRQTDDADQKTSR